MAEQLANYFTTAAKSIAEDHVTSIRKERLTISVNAKREAMSTKEQSSSLTVFARTKCKRRWKVTRLTSPLDGRREYHQNILRK